MAHYDKAAGPWQETERLWFVALTKFDTTKYSGFCRFLQSEILPSGVI